MLSFHAITLQDKDWMSEFYRRADHMGAQYSFAANFIWQDGYGITVCRDGDAFYLRAQPSDGQVSYRLPLVLYDEQWPQAVERLEQHCRQAGESLRLHGVTPEQQRRLEQLFPNKYIFVPRRDDAEYIYLREQLAELGGKKMHAKRNFVNRFCKQPWAFEPLTPERMEDCRRMHNEWCRLNRCEGSQGLCAERKAIVRSFDHWDQLDLCGAVLYQNGKAVAYTVGEKVGGDTFAVHFEKALSDVEGAYAAVNQMFAKSAARDCVYINREEDMGDEGLRRAKLSYGPIRLLEVSEAVLRDED